MHAAWLVSLVEIIYTCIPLRCVHGYMYMSIFHVVRESTVPSCKTRRVWPRARALLRARDLEIFEQREGNKRMSLSFPY